MIKSFYSIHPYKRDVIGTNDVIETISREQILDFYDNWYVPQNMTTVIIGDVNTQKALEAVKSKFNKHVDVKDRKLIPEYKLDKKPSSQIEKKVSLNVETGFILVGFKGCHPVTNKDSYVLDVLATILGEGKSSRLYKSLKEQKQLVHTVSASHSSMKDDSIFYISANYTTEDLEKLKNAIFDEIDNLYKNGLTEDELKKAKNIIERDTFYSRESISNIAAEIGYTATITNSTDYYKNYLENINKVTINDIKRVIRDYLNKDSAVISIVMPSDKGKSKIEKKEEPQKHQAKVVSKNKDTVEYELENGATLIITNNTANDIMAMEMASRGGNNLEKIPGTADITAQTMLKGTHKYKNQELSLLIEENGIRIVPFSKGDSFGLAAKFTKNEKDLALDIFEEVAKKASLDPFDIERVKADKMHSIKNIKNTPEGIAFDEFKTALWEGTPYGNTGKVLEKTVPLITQEDVVNFYKNIFPAENVVISINGNVNSQEFIDYFSKILTNSNKEKIQLSDYKYKYKSLQKNKTVKVAKDSQADWILFGWLTDGVTNEKDWASLQIIDSILGSGMSSRLFTHLRDEQGLAYQIGSAFTANVNKGVFGIYIATNPKNAEVAKKGMMQEIEKLKKEFVTYKELSEAKDKLLGNFVLSMETNMDKAAMINALEISGRNYDFIDRYPQIIKSVTVQDIIRTANKYFNQPYVLTVVGTKQSIEKI